MIKKVPPTQQASPKIIGGEELIKYTVYQWKESGHLEDLEKKTEETTQGQLGTLVDYRMAGLHFSQGLLLDHLTCSPD